jgi:hypothetical protein
MVMLIIYHTVIVTVYFLVNIKVDVSVFQHCLSKRGCCSVWL